MPAFNYRAKDAKGATVSGCIEAADERAAAAALRESGCLPMEIRLAKPATQPGNASEAGSWIARRLIYPVWTGVHLKSLALFYRQLGVMLSSGMTLSECLSSLERRTGGRLGRIVGEMLEAVRSGRTMSSVLIRYPRIFGSLQTGLIRAGETGGLLEQMLDRIASYLEYELTVRRRIARITFYPIIVLVFAILTPHVPSLVLDGGGAFAASMWASLVSWLPYVVGVVLAVKLLFQFEPVRLMWDLVKIQPPVLGTTARKIAMSRFARALALLYASGLSMGEAVAVSAEACGNLAVRRGINRVVPAIQSGHGLTDALASTGMVLPIVLDMLAAGEKTGNIAPVLERVADYFDDEVDATIHKAGILLFVVMILMAAAVVLRMAVSFYSGYFGGLMDRVQ